jgi:hypothetical protein
LPLEVIGDSGAPGVQIGKKDDHVMIVGSLITNIFKVDADGLLQLHLHDDILFTMNGWE